jgi:hypothetical protein
MRELTLSEVHTVAGSLSQLDQANWQKIDNHAESSGLAFAGIGSVLIGATVTGFGGPVPGLITAAVLAPYLWIWGYRSTKNAWLNHP